MDPPFSDRLALSPIFQRAHRWLMAPRISARPSRRAHKRPPHWLSSPAAVRGRLSTPHRPLMCAHALPPATHLAATCSDVGHYHDPTPMLPWIRGSGQASPDRHSLQPGTASRVPSGCRSGVHHASCADPRPNTPPVSQGHGPI
jgi:hypothetical protein